MSATVANNLRVNVICSVQSEGRPICTTGSVLSEKQCNDERYVFSTK